MHKRLPAINVVTLIARSYHSLPYQNAFNARSYTRDKSTQRPANKLHPPHNKITGPGYSIERSTLILVVLQLISRQVPVPKEQPPI